MYLAGNRRWVLLIRKKKINRKNSLTQLFLSCRLREDRHKKGFVGD